MTATTECIICGGEAVGVWNGKPHIESKPLCGECSRKVYSKLREINKCKKVETFSSSTY